VLFGPLEPVIREALLWASQNALEIRETSATGQNLFEEARRRGIRAVVTHRGEVAELMDEVPDDLLVIGVSVAGWNVAVCQGRQVTYVPNPRPEEIVGILRRAVLA
jgi:hypothetical protein